MSFTKMLTAGRRVEACTDVSKDSLLLDSSAVGILCFWKRTISVQRKKKKTLHWIWEGCTTVDWTKLLKHLRVGLIGPEADVNTPPQVRGGQFCHTCVSRSGTRQRVTDGPRSQLLFLVRVCLHHTVVQTDMFVLIGRSPGYNNVLISPVCRDMSPISISTRS